MAYDGRMPPIDVEQSLDNLKLERDAIVLYDALASIEKDQGRAGAFRRIASNERRHAEVWAGKLTELGATVPPSDGPRLRVRFIILAARLLGTAAVADLVKALEGDEEDLYDAQGGSPEVAAIAADERAHAEIWDRLKADGTVEIYLNDGQREKTITLDNNDLMLVVEPEDWHTMKFQPGSVLLVLASHVFDLDDYIAVKHA